jgi:hypothetical protein
LLSSFQLPFALTTFVFNKHPVYQLRIFQTNFILIPTKNQRRFSISVKNQCIFGSYDRRVNFRTHSLFTTSKPSSQWFRELDSKSCTFVWHYGRCTMGFEIVGHCTHFCASQLYRPACVYCMILYFLSFHTISPYRPWCVI